MSYLSRLAALALLAWLAQNQTPAPQPSRFRTEANFVRVDVYATKGGVAIQDLTRDDLDVFEDNTPQKIESFEHVVIDPTPSGAIAADPSSPSLANQLLGDARHRAFVVFLDTFNVPFEGARAINEPLAGLLRRVVGEDDLVALMTPAMSSDQLAFGHRTQVIEQALHDNTWWGRADAIAADAREQRYQQCFPPANTDDSNPSQLAQEMARRRKERIVLESLHDLVTRLSVVREGRTAVLLVSDGWLLYTRDLSLTNARVDNKGRDADPAPGAPSPIGVGKAGTLTTDPGHDPIASDRTTCERERLALAMLDDEQYFRELYGDANRANVSFYTIDPRGLVIFDAPLGADDPPGPDVNRARVDQRKDVLQKLAINTDGVALLNSNDLRRQLTRVTDDLTSYYLLGYRSTNAALDGKYRTIKVRAKRPGIEIRARHGYNAATAAEVAASRAAADAPAPDAKAALASAFSAIESDPRAGGRRRIPQAGEPAIFHRGPSTGNQLQPAAGRVFPRSDRIRLELEAPPGAPVWTGVLLDRNGSSTIIPVTTGERPDATTGRRWLTADVTLAPLGAGDYVIELTVTQGGEQRKTLVAIRVTQ